MRCACKAAYTASLPVVASVMVTLDALLSRREHLTGAMIAGFARPPAITSNAWGMQRRFHAALDGAGLPPVVFHDLRHRFASLAVRKLSLSTVQGYLGHANISTAR